MVEPVGGVLSAVTLNGTFVEAPALSYATALVGATTVAPFTHE
jgi:hypothetical protein